MLKKKKTCGQKVKTAFLQAQEKANTPPVTSFILLHNHSICFIFFKICFLVTPVGVSSLTASQNEFPQEKFNSQTHVLFCFSPCFSSPVISCHFPVLSILSAHVEAPCWFHESHCHHNKSSIDTHKTVPFMSLRVSSMVLFFFRFAVIFRFMSCFCVCFLSLLFLSFACIVPLPACPFH